MIVYNFALAFFFGMMFMLIRNVRLCYETLRDIQDQLSESNNVLSNINDELRQSNGKDYFPE